MYTGTAPNLLVGPLVGPRGRDKVAWLAGMLPSWRLVSSPSAEGGPCPLPWRPLQVQLVLVDARDMEGGRPGLHLRLDWYHHLWVGHLGTDPGSSSDPSQRALHNHHQ